MHEYSIVAALVDQVADAARPSGGTVRKVHLRLGELSGVERPLLETAFETFRAHTVCDGAELIVHPVEARWECSRCRRVCVRGERLSCPMCAVPARMVSGDEIVLERVELEVP